MVLKTDQQETKLHVGTRLNDMSMVRAAIAEGCDPNALGPYGWTSLHEAATLGSAKLAITLLRNGGNPNIQDSAGKSSALHLAAKNGHLKFLQVLLDGGAKLNLRNVEGKIAEDLASNDACREFLQRKRIELSVKSSSQSDGVQKLYSKKSPSSQQLSRQSSSRDIGTMDSHEASLAADEGNFEPGGGQMRISFEFNRRYASMKINFLEIKDLMLPTDHNYKSLYVKCYLLPDKEKKTKKKTSEIKIESSQQDSFTSRTGSADSACSTDSTSSLKSRKVSQKLKAALQKRHLPTKLPTDRACVFYGGITTPIGDTITYDSHDLHQADTTSKLSISICGHNRWTTKGQVIATIAIPLAIAMKKFVPQWYPVAYQISMPSPLSHEDRVSELNKSFESKEDGHYTGRSLAWNSAHLALSMCDVNTTVIRAANADQGDHALGVGKPPLPAEGQARKLRKHPSKAAKFFKTDIFKGRRSSRHCKSGSMDNVSTNGDSLGGNKESTNSVEFIRDVNRDSESNLSWADHNYRMGSENSIQTLQTDPQELVSIRPSLKYSRAFNDTMESSVRCGKLEPEMSVEEVDDLCQFEVHAVPSVSHLHSMLQAS